MNCAARVAVDITTTFSDFRTRGQWRRRRDRGQSYTNTILERTTCLHFTMRGLIIDKLRLSGWCWSKDQRHCVRAFSSTHASQSKTLPPPTILHSSNHLLAVSKPAGWQSVPNLEDGANNSKCLVTHFKDLKHGGGSDGRFLMPLHRLDQPVTGILLLGKTSKAASRIQSAWKQVRKHYICVLEDPNAIRRLQELSTGLENTTTTDTEWMQLSGHLLRQRRQPSGKGGPKGWSVQMVPNLVESDAPHNSKLCSLQWKVVSLKPAAVLHIQTDQGARHMIRALLSQVGRCSIAGDLRYGATKGLTDQSVALHAYRLQLPAQLKLGQDLTRDFVAPLPPTWASLFGVRNQDVQSVYNDSK